MLILFILLISISSFLDDSAYTYWPPRRINVQSYGANGADVLNDYQAINFAMKNIDSGDTLYFPPGKYFINKTLSTYHSNTNFLFADSAFLISTERNVGLVRVLHDSCSFIGGAFIGNGLSSSSLYKGYGILLNGVSNCVVKNVVFKHISGNSIFLFPKSLKIGCSNCRILNNKILYPALSQEVANGGAGIMIGYSGNGYFHRNNVIDGNYIDGNKTIGHGIAVLAHADSTVIRNNTVKNCLRYGIVAYETAYVDSTLTRTYIIDNRIYNIGALPGHPNKMGMGIYLMKSHYSVVSGNKLYNCLQNPGKSQLLMRGAIAVSSGVYCKVDSNLIVNSGMYGLAGAYCFNSAFTNNIIKGAQKDGIRLINTSDNLIKGNKFFNIKGNGFSAYFKNTKDYPKQQLLSAYKSIQTGFGITFINNVVECNRRPIQITGDGNAKWKHFRGLNTIKIENNNFVSSFNRNSFLNATDYPIGRESVKNNSFR